MRYINLRFTAAYGIQPENDGVRGQRDKIATTNFMAVGLSAVNQSIARDHHSIACPLSTPPRSCRRLMHPGVWHRISRAEIKRTPCMHASHGRRLNNIIIVGWAKRWQTSSIDTPGRRVTPTAESVSVPYSSPMFDVPHVSRFYRCSISDVHIGRSLVKTVVHWCCLVFFYFTQTAYTAMR